MMMDIDPTPIDDLVRKNRPRFRWRWTSVFVDGGFWEPMNYAAETIHLMKTYGRTNIARRFKE